MQNSTFCGKFSTSQTLKFFLEANGRPGQEEAQLKEECADSPWLGQDAQGLPNRLPDLQGPPGAPSLIHQAQRVPQRTSREALAMGRGEANG